MTAQRDGKPYGRVDFKVDLRRLGMTQGEFARRTALAEYTVRHWDMPGDRGGAMPSWVPVLMEAWLKLAALHADRAG